MQAMIMSPEEGSERKAPSLVYAMVKVQGEIGYIQGAEPSRAGSGFPARLDSSELFLLHYTLLLLALLDFANHYCCLLCSKLIARTTVCGQVACSSK